MATPSPLLGRLAFVKLAGLLLLPLVLPPPAWAVDVTVGLDYSTYVGTAQTGGTGVTQWLGLRYAAPPLGSLRFARPRDPPVVNTTQPADAHGKYCLATGAPSDDAATSEDCLFLDVYAPSNATTRSRLPVFLFIQGGGFNVNSNPNLNGTGLVNASGNNIVVVTINYRVGPYGFLTDGDEVPPNNGLFDQRKAMEWVQKYIGQFGGDPDHVVLGGDSAGAASISLHLMAYGGRDDGLFHAVAAESVSFATVYTARESRWQYDNLAVRLGCVGRDTLACLRRRPAAEVQDANHNTPFPGAEAPPLYMYNPVVDGDLLRELTYAAVAAGRLVRVPALVGDDTNGGTSFAPPAAASLRESNQFVRDQFPFLTPAHLGAANALYPNPNASACPAAGCYWRQAADVYGEMRYMCPGLRISSSLARAGTAGRDRPSRSRSRSRSWAYRWDVEDADDEAAGLGVRHTVELNAVFGPANTNGAAPASYYPGGANAAAVAVAQGYWTSFIRSLDPNAHRAAGSAEWAPWDDGAQARMLFSTGGGTAMEALAGTDLMARCEFWYGIGVDIRQ